MPPVTVTIETLVDAPIDRVWACWTTAEDVCGWNAASPDWHTPRSTIDLRVGGSFSHRMEARDGSEGFDLEGTYLHVDPPTALDFVLADDRVVTTRFEPVGDQTRVVESFETEDENSVELQRAGWQAILDNFKAYVERT